MSRLLFSRRHLAKLESISILRQFWRWILSIFHHKWLIWAPYSQVLTLLPWDPTMEPSMLEWNCLRSSTDNEHVPGSKMDQSIAKYCDNIQEACILWITVERWTSKCGHVNYVHIKPVGQEMLFHTSNCFIVSAIVMPKMLLKTRAKLRGYYPPIWKIGWTLWIVQLRMVLNYRQESKVQEDPCLKKDIQTWNHLINNEW